MLILKVLWLAFRSARVVVTIFLSVPFAVVCAVAALAIRHIPFAISAGIRFIALSSVAILNGLGLVGARGDCKTAVRRRQMQFARLPA